MSTILRSILVCAAVAVLGTGYACSDTPAGSSRTTTGGDTGAGGTSDVTTTGAGGNGTTGTPTGAGGQSTTATATSTTGAGGSGPGTGGAGGSGGSSVACGSNGQPYTGPLLGRCSPMSCTDKNCGTSVGKGGFLTLDDFETSGFTTPVTGTGVINMTWPSRDGRNGAWHQYSDPAAMGSMVLASTGGGGSPDSVHAIHYTGGKGMYGATLALPLGGAMASGQAGCYDASAYDGVSFWIKGNAAAGNTQIKFNVQSPVSEPAATGGACTGGCYDHFSVMVPIPANWTRVKVPWSDLKRQACTQSVPATPDNFQPQKQILAISFQQVDPTKGFDFWIDDVVLDVDKRPATDFASTVSEAIYNEMYPSAHAPYTYAGFVAAVNAHGAVIAHNANQADNKHEAAAFLAHIAHETGSLTTVVEKCVDTCGKMIPPGSPALSCTGTEPTRACTASPFYGRGALQLTSMANYQNAQDNGHFAGIVASPDLVATNVDFAFGTAAWFWTTYQSAKGICHDAIVTQKSFAQTTNIINGIECGGTLQDSRIALFKQFCAALGVNAGGTLGC
jgi:chitinase